MRETAFASEGECNLQPQCTTPACEGASVTPEWAANLPEYPRLGTHGQFAVRYRAELGWCVVPAWRPRRVAGEAELVCSCQEWATCPNPGKHPSVLWRDITGSRTVQEVVSDWCKRPNGNIALLPGIRSGVVVADIDPRHGGTLDALLDEGWPLETCMVQSGGSHGGRRGLHGYAAIPPGTATVRSWPDYLPGIELKADKAIAILPPSIHPSGRRYAWAELHSPSHYAPAPLPAKTWERIAEHTGTVERAERKAQEEAAQAWATLEPADRARLIGQADIWVARALWRVEHNSDGGAIAHGSGSQTASKNLACPKRRRFHTVKLTERQ